MIHAPWCQGVRDSDQVEAFDGFFALCGVADCEIDARWSDHSLCECRHRNWDPGNALIVEGHDFGGHEWQPEWIHNDSHLVCKTCGIDGT